MSKNYSKLNVLFKFFAIAGIFLLSGFLFAGTALSEEKIIYSILNASGDTSTLYTMNPDAANQQKLFSFESNPKDTQGKINNLFITHDGKSIYFNSNNNYLYTPARNNIFRISSDGTQSEQITPGPNSGKWNQPCPCGTVSGIVQKSNGDPYMNCPVFLEGAGMKYSGADGSFRFENVPAGVRWITAYRPDNSSVFNSMPIDVKANLTASINLTPSSDYRLNYESPQVYNNRIYHILDPTTIQWCDDEGITFHEIYNASGGGCSFTELGGFNISPVSGKILISDFANGCTTNRGIYTSNQDGDNPQLLIDMKSDYSYCDSKEAFWSSDNTKIAAKVCYNYQTCLAVYDAVSGSLTGSACFDQNLGYTVYNVQLYGFSPDNKWLLFSSWLNDPANGELSKIGVKQDGTLDFSNGITLLSNVNINSATWGNLSSASPSTLVAPTLQVQKTSSKITIFWNAVAGAQSYTLYVAPLDLSTIIDIPMGNTTTLSVDIWQSPSYYIAVRANNQSGSSDYSNLKIVP